MKPLDRWAIAAFMVFAAASLAYIAVGAFSNLWAEYKDSPDSTYIAIGSVCGVGSVGLVAAAVAVTIGWRGGR